MIEQEGGTGNGGRVTLRDLYTSLGQLRAEILATLQEERKSRHDLANRVMTLEIFRAGVEELIKGEIDSADETHTRLENAVIKTSDTLEKYIKNNDLYNKKNDEEKIFLRQEIKEVSKRLTILFGIIVAVVNLLAPLILKIILSLFGISV